MPSKPDNRPAVALPAWRRGISAAALMHASFPPIRFVVPGYIIEGLTVLAGAPKARKSWMMLDMALAVASGDRALGSIRCDQGDVLYLALEDNARRLQDRLRKMGVCEAPERLTLCTEWPTGDDALAEIEEWAEAVECPMLAIVDTKARIREMTDKDATYDTDYRELSALQDLASRLGIAIVVVHHTRKSDAADPFDEVSGTRGITGAADTVIVIRRENTGTASHRATLYGRGRDIPEIEHALEFDDSNFRWHVLGEPERVASTVEQQEVLDFVRGAGGAMKLSEIANQVGKSAPGIHKLLAKLLDQRLVRKTATGTYTAVETGNPVNEAFSGSAPTPELTELTVARESEVEAGKPGDEDRVSTAPLSTESTVSTTCEECDGEGCLWCADDQWPNRQLCDCSVSD